MTRNLCYRLLSARDVIMLDDELLLDDCQSWESVRVSSKLFVGMTYSPAFFVPVRRPISGA